VQVFAPKSVLLLYWRETCIIFTVEIKCIYTECFTTCRQYCRRWFPTFFWSKCSYKHVSDFGRLRSYDSL